jgi:Ca-activated chloride channel family protein
MRQDGKVVGGSRTYGRPQLIEVNPGVYDVQIAGLFMSGLETTHTFNDVSVTSGNTTEISHSFKTGKAMIGAKSGTTLVDATVNIKEKVTGKSVAGGRTYTSASSNPKEYLLNPGIYEVVIKAITKEVAGKSETFVIEVKQGETIEKVVNF